MTNFKKFKPFTGTCSFKFKDPDTGYLYDEPSQAELYQRIKLYRQQNGLEPIEMLQFIVENYQCSIGCNAGRCEDNDVLHRGFVATAKGGISLLKSLMYKEFASYDEAQARADICVKCPHNVFPDRGKFITWTDKMAEWMTGGKEVKGAKNLGNCGICTCPLKAKVFQGGKVQPSIDELNKMPDFCWQKGK